MITGVPHVVTKAWDEAELMSGLLDKTHRTLQAWGRPSRHPEGWQEEQHTNPD